ncbi:MAG: methanogenesis marker 1 protein [Syntrophus sp. (in: bacteria)]|nr:methanogenesis marker 1 protein [Syntrophus sp. (in: bacteria)]
MAKITLNPCPKAYMLETHRSKSPADTFRFIDGMKETLGMNSFRDATSLDRIGLPVFTCWRIRPDQSKTWHTGKGLTAVQAQVSLTMEAIERYCSEFRDEYRGRLILDSYRNLKKKSLAVLDPATLILPQFSQYAQDDVFYWVSGYDLIGGEEILAPACAVYHPFHLDDKPLINTHTDGIASGNTMEEAVFHALMEVIERDAWSIVKFSGDACDAIAVEDRPENQFLLDIVDKFNRADIEITAKDITSNIGIPVIAAFSQDLEQESMIPIDGFGAHLDPKVAMARALTETATTRALFIQKYGFDGLREDLPAYYFMDSAEEDFRFFAHAEKALAELEVGYHDDLLEDIKKSAGILQSHGYERLIVVDMTRPDCGLPTVRVIVPGMEAFCFDNTRKGPRLFRGRE